MKTTWKSLAAQWEREDKERDKQGRPMTQDEKRQRWSEFARQLQKQPIGEWPE